MKGFTKEMRKAQRQVAQEMEKERPAREAEFKKQQEEVNKPFDIRLRDRLAQLASAGAFARLPEVSLPEDDAYAAFLKIQEATAVAMHTFYVFRVGEVQMATLENIPTIFRGFVEGMSTAQKAVILEDHFSNAVVRHFLEGLIVNGNQAAMIVINLFRAGRVSEITDKMLRDLNYWYNKERSRDLAEFRRLVAQYGACESPSHTVKDLETAMLITTMKGLGLEERVREVEDSR